MPSHNHSFSLNTHTDPGFPFLAGYRGHNTAITTGYQTNHTGESKPHNNMQKYITCYIFKRIE
jgi:hypothetical protein